MRQAEDSDSGWVDQWAKALNGAAPVVGLVVARLLELLADVVPLEPVALEAAAVSALKLEDGVR